MCKNLIKFDLTKQQLGRKNTPMNNYYQVNYMIIFFYVFPCFSKENNKALNVVQQRENLTKQYKK